MGNVQGMQSLGRIFRQSKLTNMIQQKVHANLAAGTNRGSRFVSDVPPYKYPLRIKFPETPEETAVLEARMLLLDTVRRRDFTNPKNIVTYPAPEHSQTRATTTQKK